jgi:hypothetical protein
MCFSLWTDVPGEGDIYIVVASVVKGTDRNNPELLLYKYRVSLSPLQRVTYTPTENDRITSPVSNLQPLVYVIRRRVL